jgi:hypothetical protein
VCGQGHGAELSSFLYRAGEIPVGLHHAPPLIHSSASSRASASSTEVIAHPCSLSFSFSTCSAGIGGSCWYRWKRAEPSSARCGSLLQRAELGSARPSGELEKAARLGSLLAREPARRANELSHKRKFAL